MQELINTLREIQTLLNDYNSGILYDAEEFKDSTDVQIMESVLNRISKLMNKNEVHEFLK